MPESILAKLESSRKELLDLGLRNPLINYKRPKSKGLSIIDEKSVHVFDILVKQGKAMSFQGKPGNENIIPTLEFEEYAAEQQFQLYTDTKLQVNETETVLQNKLLNILYAANTSIEEHGVNILYITLGMIKWYDSAASEEERVAPLILIPVSLDRSSARERFRVRYSLEDIGHNLSFQAKLKAEFGIHIPDLTQSEDISVEDYFSQVANTIKSQPKWSVRMDQIELGFFSFGKFMIYHDLDNSKWPEQGKPVDHPILQSLFSDGFRDTKLTIPVDVNIDKDTDAHKLFQVVDADSSQVHAMLAVEEGKNLVIQGPPGTGKSQTITNIIANSIGQGKKVLFVAEKMAALEVVKRRMDMIGLGEACLELHSHKANKKQLHEELKRVLELGKPSIERLQQEVELLSNHKNEINDYCIAVNEPVEKSGLTPHQIYGLLLRIQEETGNRSLPKIAIHEIHEWTLEKQQLAESNALKIQERLKDIGVPSKLCFWGVGLKVLLPHEQENYKSIIQSALESVDMIRNEAAKVANIVSLSVPVNREECMKLATIVQLASVQPKLEGIAIHSQAWVLQKNDIEELLHTGKRLAELHHQYDPVFLPEAWDQDLLEVRQHLNEHGEKWYKFLLSDYNQAIKKLKLCCTAKLPNDLQSKIRYTDAIIERRRLDVMLKEDEMLAKELFGMSWKGRKSDWEQLNASFYYLRSVHLQIIDGSCPAELLNYLSKHNKPAIAAQCYESLIESLNHHGKSVQMAVDKLKLNEELRFKNGSFAHQLFINQSLCLTEWLEKFPEIQLAISWNNLVDVVNEQNLSFLIAASIDWTEASEFLNRALQKSWYEYLIEWVVNTRPPLRKFERSTHEEVIKQFKRLDIINLQCNRALAALKHYEQLPTIGAGGQVMVLRNEFNKRSRHMPIRKLVQEAGQAIQAIKPVFMMSPLSIANFLSPGSLEFDLVIFDEASQVRPVEALGAIFRGKQLVVVGDTKQLPPTSFFDTLNDNIDEEENVTADMQSILGMCDAQGSSQTMLRWHYRSRHESLIAISNYEFYENKLVVFPSPGSRNRMGLAFHYLPSSVYDRGQTRTNPKEAEYVAKAVMQHARQNPKQSLGVVAFSSAQREAIQNVLELERRTHPELEDFFRSHSDEPFFVKNLENVQGDERDVIFISIGYGKTKEGYLSMSFGPLNNDGGERRLNVLITRAKFRCEVFANITSADIDLSKSQKRGIAALKSFLHFAEHGKLDIPVETGRPFDSYFEEQVALQLTKLGYIVRQQVGSIGFYLDLAIVDPEHPGRYLLGIECDGAAYHSARSARDRDRLRQQVLEGIGWRIHRVWSTDWFRNPERELERLVEAIEKAKQIYHIEDIVEEDYNTEANFVREQTKEQVTDIRMYEFAILPREISSRDLHLHTVGKLASWVEEVVRVESPVHFDEAARRIVEAAGITRIGSRIKQQLWLAVQFAEGLKKIRVKGEFIWHSEMEVPVIRNRSEMSAGSKKVKYIAPEELVLAVEKVVSESIAIQPESAVPFIARIFGFSRVTEEVKEEILDIIKECLKQRKIQKDGEFLRV